MSDVLWYGGLIGATICMLLVIIKFFLLVMGSDTTPCYAEFADKLPHTKALLCGLALFLVCMMTATF